MVDAVVSFVVERLGDYLIQEAIFLHGVRDEVAWLKKEFEWMLCFVKDAEEKEVEDAVIRQWVSDIRDIAYDTEDVLDKFMVHVDDREGTQGGASERRLGFFASIKNCSCMSARVSSHKESTLYSKGKEKVALYSIGKEIEVLKKRLSDVSRRCELYGLQNIIRDKGEGKNDDLGRLKQLRRATSFAAEEKAVGFEDDIEMLLTRLFDKEPRRLVISIYGMGGLGKTTLARKLYHNNDVKNKFDCCAWVSVSQDYSTKDLLLRIIRSFNILTETVGLEKKTEEELERYLYNSLQECSYFMVIDDIWRREDWESLKRVIPDNKNGSRVIITTRIKDVAERSDEINHFHELRFLRPDEGWKLFREKAFRNSNADRGLEKLGQEMLQKCGGLPLAISVLGGLLSTKKPHEWRTVRNHIWRHLRTGSIQISYLLDLSFNDLSYQLKLCFLYLSLFPEDYEINVEKLIRLIVAEGFIEQNEDQTMEEVAKDNLDELINRSLIQVEKRCWGRVATCRVHDLMRDLAIQKVKELNFVHIFDEKKNSMRSSLISSCRRQAVYSAIPWWWPKHDYSRSESPSWLKYGNPLSRSLLLFNHVWELTLVANEDFKPLFSRFSLLRVLDVDASFSTLTFKSAPNSLPEEIGKLVHLKYLGLRYAAIDYFPPSIVNLQQLQTLDLSASYSYFQELPSEICKLQELRHLIGNFKGILPIENLTNLQTLKYVEVESWNKVYTDRLVNLRELCIESKSMSKSRKPFTFDSIAKLKNLRFLSVKLFDDESFASLQPLSGCPCLIDFRLSGGLEKLPRDMHQLLPNLECLLLSAPQLEEDPMPTLGKLPNLVILDLHFNSNNVRKLNCEAQGFPRLEILQLDSDELVEWQVEEGAMPTLRGLRITENSELDSDESDEWQVGDGAMPRLRSLRISEKSKLKIPERLRSIPLPAEWECEDDR